MATEFLIVEADFYSDIAQLLHEGAVKALNAAGASYETIKVPGALEIPAAIAMAAKDQYKGYIALGCIIRGETYHFEVVSDESARGLMNLSTEQGLAIGNGILTVETREQAMVRAEPGKDKGGDAARAALQMAAIKARYHG